MQNIIRFQNIDNIMKFAITGGAGFIGSNIAKKLLKDNHNVVIIDNLHSGKMENIKDIINDIELYEHDIRDFKKIRDILKSTDGVFHEAALTVVQDSFVKKDEYYDVNVNGTENIFKIAKEFKEKVVFASSSSIYGNASTLPIKEDSMLNPINPYGDTKLKDEHLAAQYAKNGLDVIGLRYFNVFGVGQTLSYAGVVTKFMDELKQGNPPKIFGDGSQVRDFVFVEDVADASIQAMYSQILNGFFNVGTGITTSILELAQIMSDLYNVKIDPVFSSPQKGDVQKSQADITLMKEKIKWNYTINIKDGLAKMI